MMKKQRKKSKGASKGGLAMDKELKVLYIVLFFFIKIDEGVKSTNRKRSRKNQT